VSCSLKRALGRPRRRWEDNVKNDLRLRGAWTDVAEDSLFMDCW
jgi:hypothetical protein